MNKVDKILRHLGLRFDNDLAQMLDRTRSAVALWRKNNHIPKAIIDTLYREHGVPTHIMQGKKK